MGSVLKRGFVFRNLFREVEPVTHLNTPMIQRQWFLWHVCWYPCCWMNRVLHSLSTFVFVLLQMINHKELITYTSRDRLIIRYRKLRLHNGHYICCGQLFSCSFCSCMLMLCRYPAWSRSVKQSCSRAKQIFLRWTQSTSQCVMGPSYL